MKLRPYQSKAIDSVWNYFAKKDGNPLVVMPTGTGKSLVIAGFIESVLRAYGTQRIAIATHVKELVEQDYEKLLQYWPNAPAGIYSSGLNRKDLYSPVTFCGIASVYKNPQVLGKIDLLLIDEAHLVSPSDTTMYRKLIDHLMEENPYLKVIGLTATPFRLGMGYIIEEGGIFDDICYDLSSTANFNMLINEGYLLPLIPKKADFQFDLDGVSKRGGEFIPSQLQNAVDRDELTERAIMEAREVGFDRNCWLVFTTGIEHTVHTCEMLNHLGIPATLVHSNTKRFPMTDKQRDTNIEDFKAGKYRALVNGNILTTGFDHSYIDLILGLRPSGSPGLWVQMLGRGTRPVYAPGFDLETAEGRLAAIQASGVTNCLVLDFAGNTKRLGPINDPVVPPKPGMKGGEAPYKECENDKCKCYVHASVRECPYCGYQFTFMTKLKQGSGTDALIKSDMPVVEEYKVDHITYSKQQKGNNPPYVLVSYHCGLSKYTELLCVEHEGYAWKRACDWWRLRGGEGYPPKDCDEVLSAIEKMGVATSIRVWVNKRYPDILAHCFDGTHFGKEEAVQSRPKAVSEKTEKIKNVSHFKELKFEDFEDDIPF
ncbi:DNA helicase/restriction enzyme [Alteromonas phage vB_AcoS-R7M]|uniref:DNA helicase/restriction enzyme n=1 Tax=Alteromonas phage vB_AcoS-R7M TaxID=2729541 RepID=A0A6M3YNF1_9CAUD|nr:DNA helicase/restriction enzyme [Alteromonas phage vB_AcoS-R7M]QJI53375.1 DNA helicase/restriction enzyme [Alteromonas phage vB_AcoS-R7M]